MEINGRGFCFLCCKIDFKARAISVFPIMTNFSKHSIERAEIYSNISYLISQYYTFRIRTANNILCHLHVQERSTHAEPAN